jgi:hypothetical protein
MTIEQAVNHLIGRAYAASAVMVATFTLWVLLDPEGYALWKFVLPYAVGLVTGAYLLGWTPKLTLRGWEALREEDRRQRAQRLAKKND